MRFLTSLFGAKQKPDEGVFEAPIAPDAPFVAIGDIHGCATALADVLTRIDAVHPDVPVVCVGDYVDRGEKSREVLAQLMELSTARGADFVCLLGNHEKMLLDFLGDPAGKGPRWLRFGGLQTLASFGVRYGGTSGLVDAANGLVEAMGPDMIAWLRDRPLMWQSGNVAVVHAGADPRAPLADQSARTLIWGHPDFEAVAREDGVWIVHGHTIVDAAKASQGRIAIDTGAYATGRLTAAHIAPGGVSFIEVS